MLSGVRFGVFTVDFRLVAPGREPLLWCLIAFILTFFVTRTITRYIRATADRTGPRKWWQPHNISGKGGTHIHHAVFGVILVLISGVSMISMATDGTMRQFTAAAIVFGIGAALVLDEFALILHLQDVYWSADGRTSVDAVFVAVAVAGLLVLGFNPLNLFDVGIWRHADSLTARVDVLVLTALNLALAVLVLLKGKLWTGLLGMFLHAAAVRRGHPAFPAACTLGAVALPGQTAKNAPLLGARAIPAPALRGGHPVVAARHRRGAAIPQRHRGQRRTGPRGPRRARSRTARRSGADQHRRSGADQHRRSGADQHSRGVTGAVLL